MVAIAGSSNTIHKIGETTTNIQHTVTASFAYSAFWRDVDTTYSFLRSSPPTGEKKSSLAAVHRLGDVDKELPEDAEILDFLDADIPGLSTNSERSFDFVTSEVRTQLAHLPAQQVEDILSLLGGFEKTVFETRTIPRMPPVRQLDMDITETADARPVAMRHYPVVPQHMPELERQIKALLDAGIIRESVSLYASPVVFAPKKDGKLRLCVNYCRLNRQTLRDYYPTPVASDLIARTRGSRMFSKLDL